jgi:hypothetical protein
MRWLLVENFVFFAVGVWCFLFWRGKEGVQFGLMDVILGVVVMWTGRQQLCGVVVVVFLQISGGRYLKYNFENEFGQHEQKQE